MRQRVMIAMAVILHPDLIIADEPTTALDVTIQTQIVELLKDINKSEQNAMLFITHDLNLARRICHKVVVMKDGVVVEADETEKIFMHPKEAYTRNLIEAVPTSVKPRGNMSVLMCMREKVSVWSVRAAAERRRFPRQSLECRSICRER